MSSKIKISIFGGNLFSHDRMFWLIHQENHYSYLYSLVCILMVLLDWIILWIPFRFSLSLVFNRGPFHIKCYMFFLMKNWTRVMYFPVLPFPYYASDHESFIFISFTFDAWSSTSWELIESVDPHFLHSATAIITFLCRRFLSCFICMVSGIQN